MNLYFTVTIDTECDKGPGWKVRQPISCRSVTEDTPGRLHKLFTELKVKPTYLLSQEIIDNKNCVETLKGLAGKELGTHLHSETVEPHANPKAILHDGYQAAMPKDLEEEKLANLTRSFERAFGHAPVSFRAGRFGLGPNSLQILSSLGYKVDSSVTPHQYWGYAPVAVDYTNYPDRPYFPREGAAHQPGGNGVLEVPVTIVPKYPFIQTLYKKSALFKNLVFLKALWLRPSLASAAEMKAVVDRYILAHEGEENTVLTMMFHSVEATPGASPYNATAADVGAFMDDLRIILEYIKGKSAKSITLAETCSLFKK